MLLEAACDLGIRSHDMKRFVGAGGYNRDAQLIGKVLDGVERCALVSRAASKHVVNLVDEQHPRGCMCEHVDGGALQFVQPRRRGDIGIHRADYFGIEAAQKRNGRQLGRDDHTPPAAAFVSLCMVTLELLEEH